MGEIRFVGTGETRGYPYLVCKKKLGNYFQSELDRQRLHLTEENTMLTSENEKLQLKVEDLRNEIKLDEEALTQSSLQHSLQLSNAKKEAQMLGTTLEKERVTREKIQSEVNTIKISLHNTICLFSCAWVHGKVL